MRLYPKTLYKAPDPPPPVPQPAQVEPQVPIEPYVMEDPEDDTHYFLMYFIFGVFGLALLDSLK